MSVVVVGAGLAGLRTAEALRRAKYTGSLTVIGAEGHLPYNRPPLSKEVLASTVTHDAVALPIKPTLVDVDWRLGSPAVSADLPRRTVTVANGDVLPYDGLVIATGLRPRRIDAPGPGLGRHVLRSLDDAAQLRASLVRGANVVVLGAGFIGCEVAATASALGCNITVVAIDAEPMIRPLGADVGAAMRRRHEAQGVHFRLGVGVARFEGEEHVTGVELTTGERLPTDVVVEAIASHCNIEWLDGTGLDLDNGVRTDSFLRALSIDGSPVDGVHVVGDLARFPNELFDDVPRRVEHWNIPTETGKRAGAALAHWLATGTYDGVAREFAPMPAFWSDQYDVRLQSFGAPGLATGAEGIRVLEGDLDDEAVVGYFDGDRLVGVLGIGMLATTMSYRSRIATTLDGSCRNA